MVGILFIVTIVLSGVTIGASVHQGKHLEGRKELANLQGEKAKDGGTLSQMDNAYSEN